MRQRPKSVTVMATALMMRVATACVEDTTTTTAGEGTTTTGAAPDTTQGEATTTPPAAEAPEEIVIGNAIALTGPNNAGASLSQIPSYDLWVEDVNAAGGIYVAEYDTDPGPHREGRRHQ